MIGNINLANAITITGHFIAQADYPLRSFGQQYLLEFNWQCVDADTQLYYLISI